MIQKLSSINVTARIEELLSKKESPADQVSKIKRNGILNIDLQIANLYLYGWIRIMTENVPESRESAETNTSEFFLNLPHSSPFQLMSLVSDVRNDNRIRKNNLMSTFAFDLIRVTKKVVSHFKNSKFINIKDRIFAIEMFLAKLNLDEVDSNYSIADEEIVLLNVLITELDKAVFDDYFEHVSSHSSKLAPKTITYGELSVLEMATYNFIFACTNEDFIDETINTYTMLFLIKCLYNASLPRNKIIQLLTQYNAIYFKFKKLTESNAAHICVIEKLGKLLDRKSRLNQTSNPFALIKKLKQIDGELKKLPIENKKSSELLLTKLRELGYSKIRDKNDHECYILESKYKNIGNKSELHKFDLQYKSSIMMVHYQPIFLFIQFHMSLSDKLYELTDKEIEKLELHIINMRKGLKVTARFCNQEFLNRIQYIDIWLENILESHIDEVLQNIIFIYPKLFEFIHDFLLFDSMNNEYKFLPDNEENMFLACLRNSFSDEKSNDIKFDSTVSNIRAGRQNE